MNGKRISPSDTEELINALVVTGFPTARATMSNRLDTNLDYFEAVLMKARDMRRNGSAALDLCYVAAGRQDLFWEMGLKAWDLAAAHLILQEAGGTVSSMHGEHISYQDAKSEADKFCILGSNGKLHKAVLQIFTEVREKNRSEAPASEAVEEK